MFRVEEEDFRLIPINGNRFDLELLQYVNKGKSNERKEFKNAAYGIHMETAIQYIINARIAKKEIVLDLKTYLQEYKRLLQEIKDLIN